MSKYDELYRQIGYTFADESLLTLALTHASCGAANYERLEFLGDALLDFAVGDYLYRTYPAYAEGELTRMRAQMVSNDVLCRLFDAWHLVDLLRSNNLPRPISEKVRANFVESLLGAVYLDGGMEAATAFVRRHVCVESEKVDYVSRLYEWCAARQYAIEVTDTSVGDVHHPRFVVCVRVDGKEIASSEADSIRHAKQQACRKAMQALEICTR